jgi:hypothetical protein
MAINTTSLSSHCSNTAMEFARGMLRAITAASASAEFQFGVNN